MRRLTFLLICVLANPAWAWNSGTHRLIAHIAWQQLDSTAQSSISRLLRKHADYQRWTENNSDSPKDTIAFIEAATWPDDIRQDARFYDEYKETPTPSILSLPDTARHRNWHYTDRQIDGSPREGSGALDQELPRLIQLLGSRATPLQQKVYALPWILHLVGEAHQPLHVGSRHDKGGNQIEVNDANVRRQPIKTLHRWWDDLPTPPWLCGKPLQLRAEHLLNQYKATTAQGTIELWLHESFIIARDHAYPDDPNISPEFRLQSKNFADQRVVAAGLRLGKLLQTIFGGVSRETGSE